MANQFLFSNHQAVAVEVFKQDELPQALKLLRLTTLTPVIVLVGGAKGLDDEITPLIIKVTRTIAKVAEETNAVVVDGGTQSGVMAYIGHARKQGGFRFPLLGVTCTSLVSWPDRTLHKTTFKKQKSWPLEPNHSHFILVPGKDWGDESPWIAKIATLLSGEKPSVTILVNGGDIARMDIDYSVQAGREVIVLQGSGRLADELAYAINQPDSITNSNLCQLINNGQFIVYDISNSLQVLAQALRKKLNGAGNIGGIYG